MINEIDKAIGEQCKRWRYNNDILQRDVAYFCGVSRTTVYRFEEGIIHSTKLLNWYIKHGAEIDLKELANGVQSAV